MFEYYEVIDRGSQLHAGDHVSWPTEVSAGRLQHHAIVVAQKGRDWLKVIHVRTSEGASGKALCSAMLGSDSAEDYVVAEDTLDFGMTMQNGELRRYHYEPRHCREPFEVIKSAREKIGKFYYSALSNNCEHFARECKTGYKESYQADKAEEAAAWTGVAVAACAAVASSSFIAIRALIKK